MELIWRAWDLKFQTSEVSMTSEVSPTRLFEMIQKNSFKSK